MKIHDWLIQARVAYDEVKAAAQSAFRTDEAASTSELSRLEDRILLSATPVAVVAAPEADATQQDAESSTVEADSASEIAAAAQTAVVTEEPRTANDGLALLDEPSNDLLSTVDEQQTLREVVFVDESAADYEHLLADLTADREDGRSFEVFLLDSTLDGIEQISTALAQYENLNAVHILSHGTDGAVSLGNSWISVDNLDGYAGQLVGWRDALAADADLLFYGCDLASNEEGKMLVESLNALTGADVAASTDDTGHAIFGADWDLEYAVGSIETEVAFSEDLQQNWGHLLNVAVDSTSTGTSGGGNFTVSHTTSGADRLMLVGVSINKGTGTAVTSITYDGVALSLVGSRDDGDAVVEIWSLLNPNLGTHIVDITLNGTTDGNTAGVMTFTGVDQTTPLGAFFENSGVAGSGSVTVSSASDELVFGVISIDEPTDYDIVPDGSQTEDWDLIGGPNINGGGSTKVGAASVNLSWTWSGSDNWAAGGVSIKAAPANTAPVLDNTKTPVLTPINEDAGAPAGGTGTLVSSLVDFASPAGQVDNVTDPDAGALLGIAVTAADTTNGTWHYSTDNGTNWNPLGGVSDTSARLLAADANTRLYFQSNANYHGTLANAITFRAWDQTSGSNGGTADTSVAGGTTVSDSFTVGSNVPITGHTPDEGTLWTEIYDTSTATTDATVDAALDAVHGGSDENNVGQAYTIGPPPSTADQTISFTLSAVDTTDGTKPVGVFARLVDNDNFYYLQILPNDNGQDSIQLSKMVGGVRTVLGSIDATIAAADTFTLEITDGAKKIFHNGSEVLSSNDNSLTAAGTWGMFFGDFNGVSGGGHLRQTWAIDDFSGDDSAETTAFSSATDTASLTVNPVADTPSITIATTDEDTQSTSGLVISRNVADGAEVTHFKITGITNGTLYQNDGTTPINDGAFITFAQGNAGLKFMPTAEFNGNGNFTIQASTSNNDTGLGGSTVIATITVNAVNDEEVLATNTGTTVNEASTGNVITTAMLETTDVDNTAAQLTYTVTAATGNGALRLSGTALGVSDTFTQADIDGGLVTYDHNGSESASDSFNFVVDDGLGTSSPGTFNIIVTPINDNAPDITSDGGGASAATNVAENSTYVTTLQASDADVPAETLTYSISGGVDAAKFVINSSTGILTFASAPDFETPTDVGIDNVYDVTVQVSDGTFTDTQAISVTVTDTPEQVIVGNSSSSSTTGSTLTWSHTIGSGDNGYLIVSIAYKSKNASVTSVTYGGTSLTLLGGTTFSGGDNTRAEMWYLKIPATGTDDVVVNMSASSDFVAGATNYFNIDQTTPTGSIVGATGNGGTPSVTVASAANELVIDTLAQRAVNTGIAGAGQAEGFQQSTGSAGNNQWGSSSQESGDASVTMSWTMSGGTEWALAAVALKPHINVPPTIALPGSVLNYTEGDGKIVIDATATATDSDSTDFDTGTLTVDFATNGTANDRLAVDNEGTGAGQIGVSGSDVTYEGTNIGTFAGGTDGATPLVITLNGSSTPVAVQALMRNITYENVSENPSTATRTVRFVLTDGDGGTSTAATESINVTAENDAPTVSTTGSTLAYVENDPATVIDAGLTVSDPDNANLDSVVVRITGNFTTVQDVLAFSDQLGITGNWNAGTGILTLSGPTTAANYQTALRTVTYQNTSDNPNTAVRTISFTADDGIDSGLPATRNISITAVNDEEVLANNTGTTVNEASTGNVITTAMLETTDVDNTTGQLTYTVTAATGNGTLRLSGTALGVSDTFTQADIDAGNITYDHDGSETVSDSFDFNVDDGAGTNSSGTFNLTVTPVNDEEVLATNAGTTVNEASSGNVLTTAMLETTDVDNTTGQLTYTVTAATGNGTLRLSGTALGVSDTFTQADIDGGLVTYDHDGSETVSDSFDFSADDGAGTSSSGTFNVTITAVNDAPVTSITAISPTFTENGGSVGLFNSASIDVVEAGDLVSQIVITVDGLANGNDEKLIVDGHVIELTDLNSETTATNSYDVDVAVTGASATVTISKAAGFTEAAAESLLNILSYNNTSEAVADGVRVVTYTSITDDGGGTDTTANGTASSVTVNAANDAPVLDNSGTTTLPTITKLQTNNGGASVATIIASAGGDRINDVDSGAVEGIAITTLASGNGTWEYSINGGASWSAIGAVSNTSALLLGANENVRFVPNGISGTTASFDFHAWDQTTGTAGTKVNVTSNGGTTAFSTATETADITVTDVNAAPVLDNTKTPELTATNEDAGAPSGAMGTLISSLVDFATPSGQVDNVTDVDSGSGLGIAVTAADATNGTWFYSVNNGSTWNALGAVSDASARLLAADANTRLYFQANADYHGTVANAITFHAWDQNSGINGGMVDLTATTTESVRDNFSSTSFGNNDGTESWTGDWQELGESNGPSSGNVQVTGSPAALRIGSTDVITGDGVLRKVDLSQAIPAAGVTLTLDAWRSASGPPATITLAVSDNGGTDWTNLQTWSLSSLTSTPTLKTFDITAYASANTQIRFLGGGEADAAYFYLDNLQIEYDIPATGGKTAFSTATDTASLTVNPVADTPSVTAATTNEDTQSSSGLVISRNVVDGAEVTHYKITGITDGTLYKNDGVTQITNGSFVTFAEGNAGLKFTPTADFNGNGNFTIQASTSNNDTGLGGSTVMATITVNAVNDEEVLATNTGATVNEASTGNVITTAMLETTDVDNTAAQLTYTVTTATGNGALRLSGTALGVSDTFTQADIDAGNITFDHNGSETVSDSFDFSVDDGAGTNSAGTFNLTVTPVNDEEVLATNTGTTVNEASTGNVITTAMLETTDADNTAVQLTYTVTAATVNGTLRLSGTALSISDIFTQADIDAGNITYDHDGSETVSDSFDFSVDDGAGTNSAGTFNLTVTPVNDEEVLATNTGTTVNEASTGNVITTAMLETTDVDNTIGQLTYTVTSATGNGTLRLSGTALGVSDTFTQADIDGGLVTYDHDGSETISDSFDFSVDDGAGTNSSGTFNLTVTPVNDEEVLATNTGTTVNEASSGNVITTAMLETTDADNTTGQLIYTVTAATGNGTLRLAGTALGVSDTFTQADIDAGSVTYDHDGSETVSDSFNFSADDGVGTTSSGTFNVTVTPVNDEEVLATNTGTTVNEASTGNVITTAMLETTDADNTAVQLTYTVTAATVNGTLRLSGTALSVSDIFTQADIDAGNITYDHDGSETVSDSFDFSVDDGAGTNSAGTFNLTVTPVNDEEVLATNTGTTVNEASTGNVITTAMLETTDVDNTIGQLTYTVTSATGNGTLRLSGTALGVSDTFTQADIDGGLVTYDHDGSETISDSFDFSVDDGAGTNSSGTFNLTVTPVNDEEVLATNTGTTVNEASSGNVITTAMLETTDADNTTGQLIYTVTAATGNGTLRLAGTALGVSDTFTQADIDAGSVTYDHDGSETVSDSFNFSADDGVGTTSSGTFNVTVTPVNNEEVLATNTGTTVNEASSGNVITTAMLETTDVDNTAAQLTYTITAATGNGTLRLSGTALSISDTFTQADIDAGTITYDHDGSETVSDSFDFNVDDGAGTISSGTFNFTVTPVNNDEVLATNTGTTVNEASTGNVLTTAMLETTDVDNTAAQLTYTVTAATGNGTLRLSGTALGVSDTFTQADIDGGLVTYDHNGSETVSDSFDFSVDDAAGTNSSGTFNFTVTPVNDEEVLATNTGTTVNEASSGNVLTTAMLETTDVDNTAAQLTYTVTTATGNGALRLSGTALGVSDTFTQADIDAGNITYDHNGSETVSDSFDFNVDDGAGTNSAGTFNLTVTPVNDEEVLATNTGTTVNEASTGNVITTAMLETTDADNTAAQLTYTVTAATGNGTLRLSGTALGDSDTFTQADIGGGLVSYDHNGSETVSDSFDFSVDDVAGTNSSGTFNLTVTPVNDEEVLATNTGTTVNEASTGNVITTAMLETTDVDNTAAQLTYTVTAATGNGTLRLSGTALGVSDTFTQADIDGGLVTYDHNGSETVSDSFDFSVDDVAGTNSSGTFNLTVTPINDEEVLATNTGTTVNEASTGNVITTAMLETTDVDNTAAQLTYTVTAATGNGTLRLSGTALGDSDTFTQAHIDGGLVTYDHNGSETVSDSFDFSVDDAAGTNSSGTFNFTVTPVNNEEVLATNTGTTVNEASSGNVITTAMLETTDVDNTTTQLTYTVTAATGNGTLRLSGTALGVSDTFTQANIDAGLVTYDHNGSETVSDSFDFNVDDGAGTNSSGTFNLTVTPVNDEEVLATNTGTTVNEASTGNVITTAMLETTDVDNTTGQLTYTVTTASGNGILRLSGTAVGVSDTFTQADIDGGLVTYDHDGSETVSDSFDFSVDDASGTISSGTFNFTVTPVNDEEVLATNTGTTVNEASIGNVITTAMLETTDVDNTIGQLTYTVTAATGNGTLRLSGTALGVSDTFTQADIDAGNVTYDHDGSETVSDSFDFNVDDAAGTNSSGTFNFTVTPVNNEEVLATNTGTTVNEASGGNVLTTAMLETTDVDNTAAQLTYTVTAATGNGTLRLSGTALGVSDTFTQADIDGGLVSYDHDGSETVSDSFDFSVDDAAGTNSSGTFNFTVTPVNNEEVLATNTGTTVNEASSGNVLTTAMLETTDVDNTAAQLVYTVTTATGNGTLRLSGTALGVSDTFTQANIDGGLVTYDHDGSETVSDAFDFSVDDGAGTNSSGTFNVTVTPVNDEEVLATNTGTTVNEASSGNVLTTAMLETTDVDNTAAQLVYTVTTTTGNGTLRLSGTALGVSDTFTQANIDAGLVTYDHNGSETVSDSFDFNVDDGAGTNSSGTFNLTVTPVNDEEVLATNTGTTVNEASTGNVITTAMLETTDVDNTTGQLTYTVTTASGNGILRLSGTAVGVSDTFTQADIDGGLVTYDHDGSETVSDSFDFSVDDASGTISSGTFNFTVTPVNDEEVLATNTGTTVNEASIGNVITTAMLETTDVDNTIGQLTYTVTAATGNGTLRLSGTALGVSDTFTQADIDAGNVTYDHDGSETVSDSFDFNVDDAAGTNSSGTFNFTVTPVNNEEVLATNTGTTVNEASSGNVLTTAMLETTDVDNTAAQLTYTVTAATGNGTLRLSGTALGVSDTFTQADIDGGLVTYDHDGRETVSDSFDFNVDDAAGTNNSGTFNITVISVNDEEVLATNTGTTVNEASSGNVLTTAMLETTDVDNTAAQLTYTVTAATGNGTLRLSGTALGVSDTFTQADLDGGSVTYDHDGSETVSDAFDFSVDDGAGTSSGGTFKVTVTPINDAPVATADSFSVDNDATLNVGSSGVLANDTDVDGGPLSVTLVTGPTNGTLTLAADGSFTYTATIGFSGTDSFVYLVSDGIDVSAPTVVSITVNDVLGATSSANGLNDPDPTDDTPKDDQDDLPPIIITPDLPINEDDDTPEPTSRRRLPKQDILVSSGSIEIASEAESELAVTGAVFNASFVREQITAAYANNPDTNPLILSSVFETGSLFHQLDSVIDDLENHDFSFELVAGTTIVASGAISVGFVMWAARAGYFLTMLSTSLPAWAMIDPVPVLDADALAKRSEKRVGRRQDKSLADIVDEQQVSVSVRLLDDHLHELGTSLEAVTRDISSDGMGLVCNQPIAAEYIRVQLTTPKGEVMDVLANVRHCSPDGQRYHVGLSIVADWSPSTIDSAEVESPNQA